MTECKKIRDYLSQYFDGKLDMEESARIQEHVKACADCTRIIDEYAFISSALQQIEEIDPGEFAFNRIKRRIIKEEERKRKQWRFIEFSIGALGLTAAGVVLVIFLHHSPTVDSQFEIAKNLEILKDMDLIQNLDFYEYLADEFPEDI